MDDESLRWNFWSHLRFLRLPPVQTCASFSSSRVTCMLLRLELEISSFWLWLRLWEGSIRKGGRIFKRNFKLRDINLNAFQSMVQI